MRVSLGLEVVQRAGERIAEPLYWPVYFAVDDPALRFLTGDVAASDWLLAPGALNKGEALAWTREVAASAVAGPGYLGFGLMVSDGGAFAEATQAAYEELLATVHTLALDHVAQASGMGVLLGAFGSTTLDAKRRKAGETRLDRLHDGLDPEELRKELDEGLVTGLAGFRAVGETLLPFTPGVTATALRTSGKPSVVPTAAGTRAPVGRAPLEEGTVVAVTVQAWRVDEIADKGPLEIGRELPTRGGGNVSLTLKGRVGREDPR